MSKQFMTFRAGVAIVIRIMVTLIPIAIACTVGFILLSSDPNDRRSGPYKDFVINDVSEPQTFIIPAQRIPAVVIRYRLEGVVDNSASVSLRTSTYRYGQVKIQGVVADSAVQDFYERRDMQINYEPKGVKKGHLVIKAALNWYVKVVELK